MGPPPMLPAAVAMATAKRAAAAAADGAGASQSHAHRALFSRNRAAGAARSSTAVAPATAEDPEDAHTSVVGSAFFSSNMASPPAIAQEVLDEYEAIVPLDEPKITTDDAETQPSAPVQASAKVSTSPQARPSAQSAERPSKQSKKSPKPRRSLVAEGKQPDRSFSEQVLQSIIDDIKWPSRDNMARAGHQALEFALDQLRKYNALADNLVHVCGTDGRLSRLTPVGLSQALTAFAQAEARLTKALVLAEQAEAEASSSRVVLQSDDERRSDVAFALRLLAKLKKRLTAVIHRFNHPRRDADVAASSTAASPDNITTSNGFSDIRLYNTMLNISLGHLDNTNLFRFIMSALKRRQIPPNNATLTILLQHASRRQDVSLARAVIRLGVKMMKVLECLPPSPGSIWDANSLPAGDEALTASEVVRNGQPQVDLHKAKRDRILTRRVASSPIVKLIASSIRARDSHLLLSLVQLVYTFGRRRSGQVVDGCIPTPISDSSRRRAGPWSSLSTALLAALLYPSMRAARARATSRTRSLAEERPQLDPSLPQHHPMVCTAVLTALTKDCNPALVHRFWRLMEQLGQTSLEGGGPTDASRSLQVDPGGLGIQRTRFGTTWAQSNVDPAWSQPKNRPARWVIPVRGATTYIKAVIASTLRRVGKNVPPSERGAAQARAEAARQILARTYLSLRRHWGLHRLALPYPVGKRRNRQAPRPTELPDRYFFAVLLDAFVPRDDGPLAFVNWRLVWRRFMKRYPNGLPPPPAGSSASPEGLIEADTANVGHDVEETVFQSKGRARGAEATEQDAADRTSSETRSSPSSRAGVQSKRSVLSRSRRRVLRDRNRSQPHRQASSLELELTRLLLADMRALGINIEQGGRAKVRRTSR